METSFTTQADNTYSAALQVDVEPAEALREPAQEPDLAPSSTTQEIATASQEEIAGTSASPGSRTSARQHLPWHGCIPPAHLALPRCVAKTNLEARPGHAAINASEYLDNEEVLLAKCQIVASLLKKSKANVIYSGAGLSTAAGIGDYASRAANSLAPHKKQGGGSQNRLGLEPTLGHHVCAALESKGLVHHWCQQNHDRLAQKAGFPQERLNEIHGAWGDMKNPVLSFDDSLRKDLNTWMCEWISRVDENQGVCLALGTSLCGMSADELARTAGKTGLVIIGLAPTAFDDICAVRIWGVLDEVLAKLAHVLKLGKIPNPKCLAQGRSWVQYHPNCRSDTKPRKPRHPSEWAKDPTLP